MDFLQECKEYFDTTNLYEILDVKKDATETQIKTAYRKKSLKVHPDRVLGDQQKESAKKAFQILTKVHILLTNEEHRKVYDETGMIITDENSFSDFSTFEEFQNYWRTLFPKVDSKKLDEFAKKYIGSNEEKEDLKKLYVKFEGDLDMIYQYHFYYEEDRIREILNEMIKTKEIPLFDAFAKEPKSKKQKRIKMIEKEKKLAEKDAANMLNAESDLIKAIQKKAANNFDQMISNLEAKYSKASNSKNKKQRKN